MYRALQEQVEGGGGGGGGRGVSYRGERGYRSGGRGGGGGGRRAYMEDERRRRTSDSGCTVKVRGLPYSADINDLSTFFADYSVRPQNSVITRYKVYDPD